MQHNIILYNNKSEQNRLDKTNYLTKLQEVEGELRSDTNILNPVIDIYLLHQNVSMEAYQVNYIYIPDFGRYYFVTSFDICNGEIEHISSTTIKQNVLIRFYLQVDVLMSWKDEIKKLECFFERAGYRTGFDIFMPDKYLKALNSNKYTIKNSTDSQLYDFSQLPNDTNQHFFYTVNVSSGQGEYEMSIVSPKCPFQMLYTISEKGIVQLSQFTIQLNAGATVISLLESFYGNVSEAIGSVKLFPFDVKQLAGGSQKDNIYVGNWAIPMKVENITTCYEISSLNNIITINGGSVNLFTEIEAMNKGFALFQPYTVIELFIPYYGFVQIDITKYIDDWSIIGDITDIDIQLVYTVDLFTGRGNAYLFNKTKYGEFKNDIDDFMTKVKFAVDVYPVTMGVEIPITANRYGNGMRDLILNTAKVATQLAIGHQTYNEQDKQNVRDFLTDKKTEEEYRSTASKITKQRNIGVVSAINECSVAAIIGESAHFSCGAISNGWCEIANINGLSARIYETRIIKDDNFNKFYGAPYNGSNTVGGAPAGFIKAAVVHTDGLRCLNDERNEIESLLLNGIITN